MRYHHLLSGLVLMVAGTAPALAAQTVPPNSMGLSKGSVFDVPEPKVYHDAGTQPGQSKLMPRAYLGAPPQISHSIADFLPITAQSNLCISCHDQPDQRGKQIAKGMPTPIPASHYTDLRTAPGKVTEHLVGARYNCNQCHVPQTDAAPLVKNTFSSRPAR